MPRYITITQQRPKPQVPLRYPAHVPDDDAASAIPEGQEPVSPSADTPTTLAKSEARRQQRERSILMLESSEHKQT